MNNEPQLTLVDHTMETLIARIHQSGHRGVLSVTGGGSQAIGDLLSVPGASRCILEAVVPYSSVALREFLGAAPEKYCAPETARAMAMASFWRTISIAQRQDAEFMLSHVDLFWGLGATASLKTDRPKRGEHRVHVAVQSAAATETLSLHLQKDARTRAEEERLAADLILLAIAGASGVEPPVRVALLADERLERRHTAAEEDWRAVLLGDMDAAIVLDGCANESESHTSGVIFPGAFHPLHHGHRRMAEWAAQYLGKPVEFEISVENVDKPPLNYTDISERLAQFNDSDTVWLTRAPTFVEKAQMFPGSTFVVGADTVLRIAEPRYYASIEARDVAISELQRLECRFLVFGRVRGGEFQELSRLELPHTLRELCEEVPEASFREDVSSTALRAERDVD